MIRLSASCSQASLVHSTMKSRNPIVLSQRQPLVDAMLAILALIMACGAFMVFCQNFCFTRLSPVERLAFLVVTVMATYFGQFGSLLTFIAAVIFSVILIALQWKQKNSSSHELSIEKHTAI